MSLSRLANIYVIVATNMLPLTGVLLMGWDAYVLIVFYWLETAIVGFWTVIGIAFRRTEKASRMAANDNGLSIAGVVLALFIAVHAGFFMAVHLVLMTTLYGSDWEGHLESVQAFVSMIVIGQSLWPMLIVVFVHRGLIAWDERHETSSMPSIIGLYTRIVVMQTVIIFGAWGVLLIGEVAGLLLLVCLRAMLDLFWPQVMDYVQTQIAKANKAR